MKLLIHGAFESLSIRRLHSSQLRRAINIRRVSLQKAMSLSPCAQRRCPGRRRVTVCCHGMVIRAQERSENCYQLDWVAEAIVSQAFKEFSDQSWARLPEALIMRDDEALWQLQPG